MVTSRNRQDIAQAKYVAINNYLDVDDLVSMLEVTPEDLLDRFEDRLLEHKDKFIPEGYVIEDPPYAEQQQDLLEEMEEHYDD